jgi:hypothetical protein
MRQLTAELADRYEAPLSGIEDVARQLVETEIAHPSPSVALEVAFRLVVAGLASRACRATGKGASALLAGDRPRQFFLGHF